MDPTLTLQIPFIFLCSEQQFTDLAQVLHEALEHFCPNVPVHLGTSNEPENQDVAWLLRPLLDTDSFPNPDGISSGLSKAERHRLQPRDGVLVCPMLLQRSEVPLSSTSADWHRFLTEANSLYEPLGLMNRLDTPTGGKRRKYSLVAGEEARIRITLVPHRSRKEDHHTLDPELVQRIITTFTAVEREMTLLATPLALFEHWPFSRFLEYRMIRQRSKEKADLWKKLRDVEGLTQKRIGKLHDREKLMWKDRLDDEDIMCEETKGRRREWWDVVAKTDIDKFLRDVRAFQDTDRKLALSCNFADGADEDVRPTVSSISVQSYRSTVDVKELIAYTELISNLLHLACTSTQSKLTHWLESLRARTLLSLDDPLSSFQHFLERLNTSNVTTTYWADQLNELYTPSLTSTKTSTRFDPFHPLLTHISTTLLKQRAYIPTFIERYTAAGGFYPTKGKKLIALMLEDEHKYAVPNFSNQEKGEKKEKKKKRFNEGRLDKLREVRVADAREKNEDLGERVRRSPGLRGEETAKENKERVENWIENMR